MDINTTHFERLELLVNRILDAETLSQAEEQALLSECEAACQQMTANQIEASCMHVKRIIALIETLLEKRALAFSDGQTVIQTAQSILNR